MMRSNGIGCRHLVGGDLRGAGINHAFGRRAGDDPYRLPGDSPVTRWYFDHLNEHHVDYDIIGQSYYPYWHGTLANVRENLRKTANRYHKDIVIVETAYPWKGEKRWSERKNMAWPISAEGQAQFMRDLIAAVRDTPDGHGLGVVYWHPESVRRKMAERRGMGEICRCLAMMENACRRSMRLTPPAH